MKKIIYILPMVLLFFCQCESSDDAVMSASASNSDYIVIKTISPYTDEIQYEQDVTFYVYVEYDLFSLEQAELNIGFNAEDPYSFQTIPDQTITISSGSAAHEFRATVYVKDWRNQDYGFTVYVELFDPISNLVLAKDSIVLIDRR